MGIKITRNDLEKRINDILTRGKSSQGALARIYPLYQSLQTQRFMTQNASEGQPWPALNSQYAQYKLKKYGRYPGSGSKMLIGTSTLAGAVIGPGSPFFGTEKHRALFKPWSMQISVSMEGTNAAGKRFTYPTFVAEKRPFMQFGDASRQKMKDSLSKYLIGG